MGKTGLDAVSVVWLCDDQLYGYKKKFYAASIEI
jgi:hypothetical protein